MSGKDVAAFVAGLGTGALNQWMRNRDMARADEEQSWMRKDRERKEAEHQRAEQLRKELGDAYAPRAAQSAETYQPAVDDEGNAMPANPTAGTFKVDEQFTPTGARMGALPSMEAAQTAATAANQPRAQMQRVADAYGRAGMADKALTMRGMQRQDELGELQLKQTQEAAERDAKLRQVGQLLIAGGPAAIPEVYARYNDGMTAKVEMGEGGKFTVVQMKGDKEAGRQDYDSMEQFYVDVAGQFDPKLWLDSRTKRAEKAENTRRWEAEFGLKKQEAGDRSMLRAAQAEAASARAEASRARMGGAGGAGGAAGQGNDGGFRSPEATFDSKTAAKIAEERVKVLEQRAADAGQPLTREQIAREYQAQFDALRQQHVASELSGQVRRALTQAEKDPAAYASEYDEALAMGLSEQALAQMGFKPPPGRQSVTAAPPAPAAAPKPPQRQPVDRIGDGVIGMLTPMSMIQEAAAAGNPRAIKYLKDREQQRLERDTAPRDTPSMLGLGA